MRRYWNRESFFVGFSAACGVAVLAALLYLIGRVGAAALAVATPFVASFVVALLLEPLVFRLQRNIGWIKNHRLPAVLLVYFIFLIGFVALLTYFVPTVIGQGKLLVGQFPHYVDMLRTAVNHWLTKHRKIGPVVLPKNFDAIINQYSTQVTAKLQSYAGNSAEILLGSISVVLTVVLVPIITFFVLTDMPRLRARFLFLLPERFRTGFQHIASDVGGVFGNYIRGMLIVCSGYGLAGMGVFFLFRLSAYAILLGFAAGFLYAIPYVGALTLATLAGIVSLSLGNSVLMTVGLIGAILALNMVFDNLIVPRVVGDSVGLHPLLTIFALFLGGELFGVAGMLLSVPVAASIQLVLFRIFPKLCDPTPVAMARRFEMPETLSVTRDAEEAEEAEGADRGDGEAEAEEDMGRLPDGVDGAGGAEHGTIDVEAGESRPRPSTP